MKKIIGIIDLGPMYIKSITGYNGFILIKERLHYEIQK